MIAKPTAHRYSWVAVNKDGEYYCQLDTNVWCNEIEKAKVYKGTIANAKKWARSISEAVHVLEVSTVTRSSAKVIVPAMGAMKFLLRT